MITSIQLTGKQELQVLKSDDPLSIILKFARDDYDISRVLEKNPTLYERVEQDMAHWINDKAGFIYCIENPFLEGIVKVGLTRRSVESRMNSLNSPGIPGNFKVIQTWSTLGVFSTEATIHKKLKAIHVQKEFFKKQLDLIIPTIEQVISHETQIVCRRLMVLETVQAYVCSHKIW
jgi:hypothetical protein